MYSSVQPININWLSVNLSDRDPLGSYRGLIICFLLQPYLTVWHNQLRSYVGIMCAICIYWCILWKTCPLWLRSFLLWYCYWILFHWLSFLVHFWDIAIDCVQNYLLGPENSSEHSNAWLHPQREPVISDEERSALKQNVFMYYVRIVCVFAGPRRRHIGVGHMMDVSYGKSRYTNRNCQHLESYHSEDLAAVT